MPVSSAIEAFKLYTSFPEQMQGMDWVMTRMVGVDVGRTITDFFALNESTGAGRFRGGMGLQRVVRPRGHECIFNGTGERFRHPPCGLFGRASRGMGRFMLRTADGGQRPEDKPDQVSIGPGDAAIIETPGAGGFKPAADRATGKFSDEYLNRHYGHLAQITDKEDIDGR